MDRDKLMALVQTQMPARRWNHTLGVMASARQLALQYNVNLEQADLAAILHDYVKFWPVEQLSQIIREEGLPLDLLDYDNQLWHAHVGAFVVQRDLAIDDEEVLNAIRYHTSGREHMTDLEKVVCLADYIEPGRDFPGVEKIRERSNESLESGLIEGLDSTLSFLIAKRKKIFPLTILARNALIEEIRLKK